MEYSKGKVGSNEASCLLGERSRASLSAQDDGQTNCLKPQFSAASEGEMSATDDCPVPTSPSQNLGSAEDWELVPLPKGESSGGAISPEGLSKGSSMCLGNREGYQLHQTHFSMPSVTSQHFSEGSSSTLSVQNNPFVSTADSEGCELTSDAMSTYLPSGTGSGAQSLPELHENLNFYKKLSFSDPGPSIASIQGHATEKLTSAYDMQNTFGGLPLNSTQMEGNVDDCRVWLETGTQVRTFVLTQGGTSTTTPELEVVQPHHQQATASPSTIVMQEQDAEVAWIGNSEMPRFDEQLDFSIVSSELPTHRSPHIRDRVPAMSESLHSNQEARCCLRHRHLQGGHYDPRVDSHLEDDWLRDEDMSSDQGFSLWTSLANDTWELAPSQPREEMHSAHVTSTSISQKSHPSDQSRIPTASGDNETGDGGINSQNLLGGTQMVAKGDQGQVAGACSNQDLQSSSIESSNSTGKLAVVNPEVPAKGLDWTAEGSKLAKCEEDLASVVTAGDSLHAAEHDSHTCQLSGHECRQWHNGCRRAAGSEGYVSMSSSSSSLCSALRISVQISPTPSACGSPFAEHSGCPAVLPHGDSGLLNWTRWNGNDSSWWDHRAVLRRWRQALALQANTFWSVALTATVVSVLLIIQRWQRLRRQNLHLRLQLSKKNKVIESMANDISRLHRDLSRRHKLPVLRTSASSPIFTV